MSWEKVRWRDVLNIYNGKNQSKVVNPNGRYPIYGSGGLMGYSDDFLCPAETTIIGRKGSINNPIFVNTEFWNVDTAFGLVAKEGLLPKYLYYFCKTFNFLKLDKSTTLPSLTKSDLLEIEIPLPPLPIQEKIAAILDKADALRRKDQELLKKYDELAQAIFIDMFGDPVKNEKGWEVKSIDQLVTKERHSIKRGPFGGALKKEIFVQSGYLVYEQYHALNNDFSKERYFIAEDKYKELIAFKVLPKDIIISCSGVYLGKLAVVPDNAKAGIINQALLKITLNENIMKNDFFVFHFSQQNFREKYFDANRGAGIPNFPPMSEFKRFPFICPPIHLQEEFAKKIELINQLKAQTNAEKSEELFQSLLQRAFKGELVR